MTYVVALGLDPGACDRPFDVVPTIVELLGERPPAYMSGKSPL
jgi:hypothetical protein